MAKILHIRSLNDYARYIGAPVLHELVCVIHYDKLTAIGKRYGLSCSQTAIAWAMTKGVRPIIGATKPHHVTEAAQVGDTRLTPSEVAQLERLAAATGIDTRGGWEGKA
ncbi:MAG: aldo/keto reductase [Paludibacteraceae bacterium]|nr:aldo/keto reductase [Paludibacteraceae bacterium]